MFCVLCMCVSRMNRLFPRSSHMHALDSHDYTQFSLSVVPLLHGRRVRCHMFIHAIRCCNSQAIDMTREERRGLSVCSSLFFVLSHAFSSFNRSVSRDTCRYWIPVASFCPTRNSYAETYHCSFHTLKRGLFNAGSITISQTFGQEGEEAQVETRSPASRSIIRSPTQIF